MAGNKTRETGGDVGAFLERVADPARRAEAKALCALMARATGETPAMWGRIVGFGRCHYRYESGREGDWMVSGFAVRAKELVLYLGLGAGGFDDLLARLGKHKAGKGCLYLRSLADVDAVVLENLVARAHAAAAARHAE
jgi:predicted GIY-YIG superfamily endonuclease